MTIGILGAAGADLSMEAELVFGAVSAAVRASMAVIDAVYAAAGFARAWT